jgi:hypothetical protein
MTTETDDGALFVFVPSDYKQHAGYLPACAAHVVAWLQANPQLRAEVLGKLGASEFGMNCVACGAQWMDDASIDNLSDLVEPYRLKLKAAESELAAEQARVARASEIVNSWSGRVPYPLRESIRELSELLASSSQQPSPPLVSVEAGAAEGEPLLEVVLVRCATDGQLRYLPVRDMLPGDVIAEARGEKAEPASPSPPGGQGQELCREHGACVHPNGHWWPCNDESESRPVLLGELVAALRSRDIFDLNAIADELERKR